MPSFFANFYYFHNIPNANGLQFAKIFLLNFLQSLFTKLFTAKVFYYMVLFKPQSLILCSYVAFSHFCGGLVTYSVPYSVRMPQFAYTWCADWHNHRLLSSYGTINSTSLPHRSVVLRANHLFGGMKKHLVTLAMILWILLKYWQR